jgi:UDP-N-acetylmuramate dehydrogenase
MFSPAAIQNTTSLANKTTFKIGGISRLYYAPASEADCSNALKWAHKENIPVLVLGNGSNVLVSDKGWPGLTLNIAENFNAISWNGACAECQSGALLHRLVHNMVKKCLCGLEKLAGIPGSVGGALFMNAGAFGQTITDCVVQVTYIDLQDLFLHQVFAADLITSYRKSSFSSRTALITSARFCFKPAVGNNALYAFNEALGKRKVRHPLDLPNCGSVFKNPPGITAGTLIDQCGLKGFAVGGVEVSDKHANFIVNRNNGTAANVRHLIAHIQEEVFRIKQILLEPEVVFVGAFEEPLFRTET